MRRLLILPAVTVVCVAEIYRRGFAAPLLFGARLWVDACKWTDPTAETEADYMGLTARYPVTNRRPLHSRCPHRECSGRLRRVYGQSACTR